MICNCDYNFSSNCLRSKMKWLPLKYMAIYTKSGVKVHGGMYSDSKIVSLVTRQGLGFVELRICGAIMGAITNEYSPRALAHASLYYDEIRVITADVGKIVKNTGFSLDDINRIKSYIFIDVHDLGGGVMSRFEPSFFMALSWQRLMLGNFLPHDITMLRHELLEMDLVAKGFSQAEAHEKAQKVYNYAQEVLEYHKRSNKYQFYIKGGNIMVELSNIRIEDGIIYCDVKGWQYEMKLSVPVENWDMMYYSNPEQRLDACNVRNKLMSLYLENDGVLPNETAVIFG